MDNLLFVPENHVDKKNEGKSEHCVTANGKNATQIQDDIPVTIKTEWDEENASPLHTQIINSENDDSLPDYENSMLARSLISGIKPTKSDLCASPTLKKASNVSDIQSIIRPKESSVDSGHFPNLSKSPVKISPNEDSLVKAEKPSPKSDLDYEPEILLSEHNDGTESESYSQEQSHALLLLAGMSTVTGLTSGASTSQTITSHQQSNHAAICGDCPHCGMKYSNQSALKYHVRLMHSDLTNRLCCYLCPRSFTMRETFKEHMWTSHGQRN